MTFQKIILESQTTQFCAIFCVLLGPFTNCLTHFLLFFDHPPTHSNALAIILLVTYNTRVYYSKVFANDPPIPLHNMWVAPLDIRIFSKTTITQLVFGWSLPFFKVHLRANLPSFYLFLLFVGGIKFVLGNAFQNYCSNYNLSKHIA